MEYNPGVPVLPPVTSVLGAAYARYVWQYDTGYAPSSYKFTDLDKVGALLTITARVSGTAHRRSSAF